MSSVKTRKVFYRFENNKSVIDKGVKKILKKSIIDGDLGLAFTYMEKNGNEFMRISSKPDGDKFVVTIKQGDKVEFMELEKKALVQMIKKNKKLDFVYEYINGDMKKYSLNK